jgi:curli biogenesis system outer membrane secretion channel CsgG
MKTIAKAFDIQFILACVLSLPAGPAPWADRARASTSHGEARETGFTPSGPTRSVAVVPASPLADPILVDVLVKSGRLLVVEREGVQSLNVEAGLGKQARPILAEFLAHVAVTRLEEGSGFGFGVGSSWQGWLQGVGIGGNAGFTKATVEVLVRVYDTATGRILTSQQGQGSARGTRFGLGGSVFRQSDALRSHDFNLASFQQTSVGKALRAALEKAVKQVIPELERVARETRVLDVEGDVLYFNAGSAGDLKAGDQFYVLRRTKTFTDPHNGAPLGTMHEVAARIQVERVLGEHLCRARVLEGRALAAGDVVTFYRASVP